MALKERTGDVVQDVISKAAADQQATAARLTKEHQTAVQRLTAQKDADVAAARRGVEAAEGQVGDGDTGLQVPSG